ncbi:MAG: flagellar filament capping protein FliD [Oscillospiraceae bacterium]|jgi:flagellar hook-associated protein 2|nr:flagellar filament capping protein FliD [Oscillospiraceae bacterium]
MQLQSTATTVNNIYSSKGISGLASGIDTESMVKAMLAPYQQRIDTQTIKSQQLINKQSVYRSLITQTNDFYNKYFDLLSPTNMRSASMYSEMSLSSSSSAISVLSSTASADTNFNVKVEKLATAAKLESGKLGGNISTNYTFGDQGAEKAFSFDLTLDNTKRSITVDEGDTVEDLQKKVSQAFGNNVDVELDSDNKLTFSTKEDRGQTLVLSASSSAMDILGIDSSVTATSFNLDKTIEQVLKDRGITDIDSLFEDDGNGKSIYKGLTVNGTQIDIYKDDKVTDVMNRIYNSDAGVDLEYNGIKDTLSLVSKNTGSGFNIDIGDTGNVLGALLGVGNLDGFDSGSDDPDKNTMTGVTFTEGQNSVLFIDGERMERMSNTVSYAGVTFELKETTGDQTVQVGSSRDVDKIFNNIKAFVDDYNKLIEDLNTKVTAEATWKKYPPLTEAQKKEMSEREIQLWEEKSMGGLLSKDPIVRDMIDDLAKAVSSPVVIGKDESGNDIKVSLFEFGIDTSKLIGNDNKLNLKNFGKLEIDEEKLKKAISERGEELTAAFARVSGADGSNDGLMAKLEGTLKNYASTSLAAPGRLVKEAGVANDIVSEKDSVIYKQLQDIAKNLVRLNMQYDMKKNAYWKRFDAMEVHIMRMNQQSEWLYSQQQY